MFLRLEKASGVPITRQIVDQLRAQWAAGALQSGDQLPSVRQLAHELAVNQNTVLRVYERLEAEGVIERRHGSGTYVANGAGHDPLLREREKLRREAETLARHARALGLASQEVQEMIETVFREIGADPHQTRGES
jgi:GntR family transcriptional regulator